MKNYGLIIEPQVPEDFQFGSFNALDTKFAGREVLQPDGDWSTFLPPHEKQAPLFETQSCVSHGTLNAIEVLRKRLFLKEENLSDRFVAKMSGTDPKAGNTPKKVADTIRKTWSTFEQEWAMADSTTVEDFYKEIPEKLKTLAIGRGAEYEFGYEIVQTKDAREALKYSPLCMSVYAWHQDADGVYSKPQGAQDNHWVMVWGIQPSGDYLVMDTYEPFMKQYRGTPSVMFGYYLKKQIVNDNWFIKFLKQLMEALNFGEPQSGDVPVPPKPVEPKPEPVTMVSGVNTRGRSHAWRGDPIEKRKELYQMAVEIGKAEGLHTFKSKLLPDTHTLLDDYLATIEGESGFSQFTINASNSNGTGDYGIAQFNSATYCKEYKITPQECVDNPRACLEIMAKNFKTVRRENWYAFKGFKKNPDGTKTVTYPAKERLLNKTLKIYA